jgi:colicin import membrane protein
MTTENIETASEVVDAAPKDATSTALATYDKVAAGIADLKQRYADAVYAVTTFKGMEAAKAARLEIREVRFSVQRARDAAKKHLNELKGRIEDRAEEIIGQLQPLEDLVDGQIKAEEKRRADEKEARERAERAARDAIMQRLEAIRAKPLDLLKATSVDIQAAIDGLQMIETADFDEFAPAAERAVKETTSRLIDLRDVALATEAAEAERQAEAARLAAERAELERQREAELAEQRRLLAEQRAEIERQQADLKRQHEEAEARERERQAAAEAEQRAQKAAAERQERERQEQLAAERRREDEARAEKERERAAAVAKVEKAAGLMLVALVSVRDWNAPRGALPDWIESHVNQALAAAGAPDALPSATTTEEAL